MKVLLVNGSPHKEGCTYTALMEAGSALNACGIETKMFWIGNKPLSGPLGRGLGSHHLLPGPGFLRRYERRPEQLLSEARGGGDLRPPGRNHRHLGSAE